MATLFWPAFPFVDGAENYSLDVELPRGCTRDELPRPLCVALIEADLRLPFPGEEGERPYRDLRDYLPTDGDLDLFRAKIPSIVTGPIETDWASVLSFLRVGHKIDITAGLEPTAHIWVAKLADIDQPLSPNQRIGSDSRVVDRDGAEKRLIDELEPLPPSADEVSIQRVLAILRSLPDAANAAAPTIAEPTSGAKPRKQRASSNGPRNKFCYTEFCRGTPLKEIISKLKKKKSWDPIESPQGIKAAVKCHSERMGVEMPRRKD